MNRIILVILIAITASIYIYMCANSNNSENFNPFGANNYQKNESSKNNYINYFIPSYFKMGEVNVDSGSNKNYDKYLNNLYNSHLDNSSCSVHTHNCNCNSNSNSNSQN
jgi:hypothetical protein